MTTDSTTLFVLYSVLLTIYFTIGNKIGKWYEEKATDVSITNSPDSTVMGKIYFKDWKKRQKRVVWIARYLPIFIWLPVLPFLFIEALLDFPLIRSQF